MSICSKKMRKIFETHGKRPKMPRVTSYISLIVQTKYQKQQGNSLAKIWAAVGY